MPSVKLGKGIVIEELWHENQLLALILRSSFSKPGVTFLTPRELSQQLGYMRHPKGKKIKPHYHNYVSRSVSLTQEVLFIRRGRLRVDLYDNRCRYVETRILQEGDVILLVSGGHGFEALEDLEMIEVKQGPHIGELDKTCFESAVSEAS